MFYSYNLSKSIRHLQQFWNREPQQSCINSMNAQWLFFLKVKCNFVTIISPNRIAKNNDYFQTGFPTPSPLLPLVDQTDSPAPNSHDWLSQCYCVRLVEMLKHSQTARDDMRGLTRWSRDSRRSCGGPGGVD